MKVLAPRKTLVPAVVAFCLLICSPSWSQTESSPTVDRTYQVSIDIVQKGLQQIGGFGGGKLPVVDGFVTSTPDQSGRYEHPYYQYRVHLAPVTPTSTTVSVEAIVTAWYADPNPKQAEYRSLPSNGRLEKDLLDRLEEALRGSLPAAPSANTPTVSRNTAPAPDLASRKVAPPPAKPSNAPAKTGPTQEQLDAVIAERQAVREKATALEAQLTQLKTADHKPANASKLASVKHSGVGVMSRQNFGGPVLFRAQAEDEFEVVELQSGWAKVRLAPDSTAYIQSDELNLPQELVETPASASAQTPQPAAEPSARDLGFSVSREDVTTFSGDWARLKGKKVLFVYAQPRGLLSDMGNQDAKLGYAKRIFQTRYRSVSQSKTDVEGVVVVFLGTRGGIAAATLTDIQQWLEGHLADDAFVNRCSLDPPAEFRITRVN